MDLTPYIIIFAILCLFGSYGIETRSPWAWYGGCVFGVFAAGAICYFGFLTLFFSDSIVRFLGGALLTAGAICVWRFWALYWSKIKGEFVRGSKSLKEQPPDPPESV
jgi:hypothetical protein